MKIGLVELCDVGVVENEERSTSSGSSSSLGEGRWLTESMRPNARTCEDAKTMTLSWRKEALLLTMRWMQQVAQDFSDPNSFFCTIRVTPVSLSLGVLPVSTGSNGVREDGDEQGQQSELLMLLLVPRELCLLLLTSNSNIAAATLL
uniref:Uncharacterized protein n=1 Tax=Onchocerca volvulus TaxID=6282 RepID=A0A8R1TUT5_ONCVO